MSRYFNHIFPQFLFPHDFPYMPPCSFTEGSEDNVNAIRGTNISISQKNMEEISLPIHYSK